MSFLALGALLALCFSLGWALEPWWSSARAPAAGGSAAGAAGEPLESRLVSALLAGWLVTDGLLLIWSVCGVRWTWWSVGLPLLAVAAIAVIVGRRRAVLATLPRRKSAPVLGWGDGIAGFALGILVFFAARGEILFPDFVYHWGIKAQKFALAGGVDWEYLARPWLAQLHHPEYPQLLPNLGALTTLLAGGFDQRAVGLWSIAALLAVVFAVRGALRGAGVAPFLVQAGTAWTGAALAMFGIGYLQAGSADPFVALALAAALPALLAAPGAAAPGTGNRGHDIQIGLAAALAAAAKIEGVLLAAVLLAVHCGRRLWAERRPPWRAVLRAGLPVALVVLPWLYGCWRYGLRSNAAGTLDLGRLPLVADALWRQLANPAWFGMAALLLLAPVLLARRGLRALGVVALAQLGFYVYTYLSAPFEPGYYILATFPRLALHLLPAVVAGAMVGLDAAARGPVADGA